MIGRREALAALTSVFGLALAGGSVRAVQVPKKARMKKASGAHPAFDEIMEEILRGHQIFGGSLAIAQKGRLVLARGYGLADAEANRPVTPETLFCIGSVTKAITALAALRLVDEGKVALDAKLVDVIPDVRPPGGKFADPDFAKITFRQVLFHGSGIPDRLGGVGAKRRPDDGEGDDGEGDGGGDDIDEVVRRAMAARLDFPPGSTHKYSNSGYLVARAVIERASGQPYVPLAHDRVFRPAGVESARMEAKEPVPEETSRYVLGPNGRHAASRHPVNWMITPAGMVKLLAAVAGHRGQPFLSPSTYREMVALPPPPIRPNRDGGHVGLGWDNVVKTPEGDGFSKNGGKAGVSAWAQHRPDGISWAFMINTNGGDKGAPNPANEIRRRVNEALDARPAWPVGDLFKEHPG